MNFELKPLDLAAAAAQKCDALIVLLAAYLIDSTKFRVDGFWWALLFSLVVSFISSILNGFIKKDEPNQNQNHNHNQLNS